MLNHSIAVEAVIIAASSSSSSDSTSSSCGDTCGWMAALLAAVAFGSFGVPIKSDAARSVDIDPLVFQSYKTFLCFITSWLILLSGDTKTLTFTPWGIVAGLFWVPGYRSGQCILVRRQGGWTSHWFWHFGLVSSFTWGVIVFGEKVHSLIHASLAVVCLILGLLGMSYYSSSNSNTSSSSKSSTAGISTNDSIQPSVAMDNNILASVLTLELAHEIEPIAEMSALTKRVRQATATQQHHGHNEHSGDDSQSIREPLHSQSSTGVEHEKSPSSAGSPLISEGIEHVVVFGRKIPKRQWGMALAGMFGLWLGSQMVPMKLAPAEAQGSRFLISFAVGAMIVNVIFWLLRYAYNVYQFRSLYDAYTALPSLHIRVMWKPGGLSGLLWSIGNFFNLISVFYLGQGVGYPLVQSSMLISGLWGIFCFQEVQGRDRIAKWLLSSLVALCGIVMLGRQHASASNTSSSSREE